MSTTIGRIEGRKEYNGLLGSPIEYKPQMMYITRFAGGEHGQMIQISVGNEYIQLEREQLITLKDILENWKSLTEIDY